MLDAVLAYLHNWFVVKTETKEWKIEGGSLTEFTALNGQHFRIVGSVLNDGTYLFPCTTLKDETFTGRVQSLAVPSDLVALVAEIEEYQRKTPDNGKVSESFGGYTYTKGTDGTGKPITWVDVYANRLNRWRKT